MKKIYILGNATEPLDNKVIQLMPRLSEAFPKILFEPFDPTEELATDDPDLVFMDVVAGISAPTIYHDLNIFELSPRVTGHDFDLPVALRLLRKLGKIKTITIIGIPQHAKENLLMQKLMSTLSSISP
jgi:hypothetical protein